jgi:hypothetical protein
MSRNSPKAIDLYCSVLNWNDSLANGYPNEINRWTTQRDRKLAAFRKVMAKVTLDDFLSGRGDCARCTSALLNGPACRPWPREGHSANCRTRLPRSPCRVMRTCIVSWHRLA